MNQLDDLTFNKISALINIQDWQLKQEKGRAADQEHLHRRLKDLESNQSGLEEILRTPHRHDFLSRDPLIPTGLEFTDLRGMMATLQILLTKRLLGERERHFCSHTLNYLSTKSGKHPELESWMVAPLEVEFGREIGSGGLYVQPRYLPWRHSPSDP